MISRRRSHRYAVSGLVKIQPRMGALPRDCHLTDISDGGVRLHAEGVEVPDEFVLLLPAGSPARRECRVVWRLGYEVGAEFTDTPRPDFARRVSAA